MKIWLLTTLAFSANVTSLVKGSIVYPVIVNEKRDGSTKARLVLSSTHSLEMEEVNLFGDTYIHRMEINGTPVDLLLDSAYLQKNMYQCRQNMATYTADFVGRNLYVEGIVNTTHAIVPINHGAKRVSTIPHKVYRIHKNIRSTHSIPMQDVFQNATRKRLRRPTKRHLPNNTNSTQIHRPQERGSSSETAPKNAFSHDLKFWIEVMILVDRTIGLIFDFQKRLAVYLALGLNVVKLKLENSGGIPLSVRLVKIRYLTEAEENNLVMKTAEGIDTDKTLASLDAYATRTDLSKAADVIVLLTGLFGYSYKTSQPIHQMGLAYTGYVCKSFRNVIILEDMNAQYQFSVTGPHELGHQLGAPHDGPENKKHPGCPPKGAIMAAFMDGNSGDVYSHCSLESIADLLEAMTDAEYILCINVRNLTADYLQVQQHLPRPTYSHKDFCQATTGKNYYSSSFKDCVISCQYGGFAQGYPTHEFPAPYGFRCALGKICLYGTCVPCTTYQPQWKDCEKL